MGGGVDPREQDNLALAECADDAGCPGGWAQQIEGGMPFSMIDMACVVTAMRDRTPGRYAVQHNHTWGNGETDEDYTLVITPSGEVEVGMLESTSIQTPDLQMSQSYEATRRCVLLDASFFQACLDAIQMGDGSGSVPQAAWDCVYPSLGSGLPWFDSCVEQAPTCQ